MMNGAWRIGLCVPMVLAACAGTGEPVTDSSTCDVRDLSQVFHQPAAFDGNLFCGTAYSDFQTGMYSFYSARLQAGDDAYDYALIPTGLSQRQERQLSALPSGSALRIVGVLDMSRSCIRPPQRGLIEQCTPIKHPIYVEKVQFSSELPSR